MPPKFERPAGFDESFDGNLKPITFLFPNASTAIVALKAESIPPERNIPNGTSDTNLFLVDISIFRFTIINKE